MLPTKDQAVQFCIMLQAGLPASEAIMYFISSDDAGEVASILMKWQRSKEVKHAWAGLMKKPWQEMTLEERIATALDQHYAALAYFLVSHNYGEVNGTDKAKADTARQALEAKQAGVAGKNDALSQFFQDINSGKVRLQRPVPVALGAAH